MKQLVFNIKSWKDTRKGEAAWILGSGPSLDELPPGSVGKNKFALNLTILMKGYRDAWWVCRDGRCMKKWLSSNHKLAIGEDRRKVETLITDRAGLDRVRSLDIGGDKIERIANCRNRFWTGETVLVFALQVADYMGFSEIILAGVDLCDPGGVAYAKEIDWQSKYTKAARPARHNRMRREVASLAATLNARVRTVSKHMSDVFELVEV